MLDLRLIRRDPDAVRTALARRGPQAAERLDQVLALDARWREATQAAEALRAEQKAASEELAAGKREGRDVVRAAHAAEDAVGRGQGAGRAGARR